MEDCLQEEILKLYERKAKVSVEERSIITSFSHNLALPTAVVNKWPYLFQIV